MNRKYHIALILCFLTVACAHTRPWDTTEKVMGGAFVAGQVVNTGQIGYVYGHQDEGWHELNPVIDEIHKKAGMEGVVAYKGVTTGLVLWLADMFPEYRKTILGIANAVTIGFVGHDAVVGVGIEY